MLLLETVVAFVLLGVLIDVLFPEEPLMLLLLRLGLLLLLQEALILYEIPAATAEDELFFKLLEGVVEFNLAVAFEAEEFLLEMAAAALKLRPAAAGAVLPVKVVPPVDEALVKSALATGEGVTPAPADGALPVLGALIEERGEVKARGATLRWLFQWDDIASFSSGFSFMLIEVHVNALIRSTATVFLWIIIG